MRPDLQQMRAAVADVDDYLGQALELLDEPRADALTPAQADRADALVTSYLQLAGDALNRFEEAARGA